MKLFSGTSNKSLAEEIASVLDIPLSPLEIFVFPDGERRVRVEEPVVDEDCVVIQSCASPVDQNYMELFFIVDALKRSGAKSVTAVIPYLGYQRQDHVFRDGEAVSLEVIVRTLEAVGVDRVVAFDLHSIRIPQVFRIPISHLSALSLFATVIKQKGWAHQKSILISPDMGGIRRIKILSELLDNMPYAAIEKNRDLATGEVTADRVEGSLLEYTDGNKCAIIVDDMISSGGTIATAANLLQSRGIEDIVVFATHPVFSKEAPTILETSRAKEIFVTNTINIAEEKRFSKLTILSIADLVAETLKA